MKRLWPLILILCLPLEAFSNELCEKAGIYGIEFRMVEDLRIVRQGCVLPVEQLTVDEINAIKKIASIHQEVADLFRVDIHDLFSRPLTVEVSEQAFGAFGSAANASSLSIGTFPHNGLGIDKGIYLHELGHVLAMSNNISLPSILKDYDESSLFSESFADLLALTVHGRISDPNEERPSCLDRIRYLTTSQSYDYPMEYFQTFGEARLAACCDSILTTPHSDNVVNLCKSVQDYLSRDITLTHAFDPLEAALAKNIDDHQIGIPMLSFFKDFSLKTHQSFKAIFDQLFFSEKAPAQETYLCELIQQKNVLSTDLVQLSTPRNILQAFKQGLNPKEAELFDVLYTKHAIEKGMIYSESDVIKTMMAEFKEDIRDLKPEVLQQCGGKIDFQESANCYIRCSRHL